MCLFYFLVESISNAGGLGFSGYDEHGHAKWDLVRCVDVLKFEFGKNIREQTLAWNIFTQTWLKRYAITIKLLCDIVYIVVL